MIGIFPGGDFLIRLSVITVFIFFLHFNISSVFAAEVTVPVKKRPRIGVVLSGGGAKGFAHIALLEKLEQLKIPVDYIAGTSMGATVAALYSMGYSVEDLKRIARDTDWMSYFSNDVERRNRGFAVKDVEDKYPLSLRIGMDGISFPRGLVNGHRISAFLSRLTWGAHGIKDFSKLPIPFLCVATDMETGKAKVFTKGDLKEALRASMAIPSLFDPVEIDGRIYEDGGIVNNFPVKELKEMGADIIIGVDVGAPLYDRSELDSIPKILEQTTSFLGQRRTEEQRRLCDILVLPDMKRFDSTSFESTDKIIFEGERAVSHKLEELMDLSLKMRKYRFPERRSIVVPDRDKYIRVDRINFYGLRRSTYRVIRETFPVKKGQLVDVKKIEDAINYSYGSGFFEKISYRVDEERDDSVLSLNFRERPKTSLHFGLMYDNDTQSAILLNLSVNDLGLQNSSIWINARVGEFSKLEGTYFLYTPFNPGIGIGVNGKGYNMEIYNYSNGKKTESYSMGYCSGNVFLGAVISNTVFFTAGVEQELYSYDPVITSSLDAGNYRFDTMKFFANLKIDTLDDYYYPSGGVYIEGRLEYVRPDISYSGGDEYYSNFKRYVLNSRFAVPLPGPLTLITTAGGSMCEIENVPPPYWFTMGGYQRYENWIFPLYGYEFMEEKGQHGFVYSVSLQWEVLKNFYLSLRWNQGKTADNYRDLLDVNENMSSGYGVTAGYKSLFGPLEVSLFRKFRESDYTFHINLGIEY